MAGSAQHVVRMALTICALDLVVTMPLWRLAMAAFILVFAMKFTVEMKP